MTCVGTRTSNATERDKDLAKVCAASAECKDSYVRRGAQRRTVRLQRSGLEIILGARSIPLLPKHSEKGTSLGTDGKALCVKRC